MRRLGLLSVCHMVYVESLRPALRLCGTASTESLASGANVDSRLQLSSPPPVSFSGVGSSIASLSAAAGPNRAVMPQNAQITLRGRVERVRGRGKVAFILLRQPREGSVQAVCSGKALAKQAVALTPETIVEVTGTLQSARSPVTSTSCEHHELRVEQIKLVSAAKTPLPFPLHDANTKLETRLNHRAVDLRTPLMSAVVLVVSCIAKCFREHLDKLNFVEVHTPKLVAASSEGGGGSALFAVDYFGAPAYLAQSPQLYKQMLVMGDAMRVFEVGPVFRAEKSLTHRHLTEFIGLDAEFVISDSYLEVLDVLETVMCGVVLGVQSQHGELLARARAAVHAAADPSAPLDPTTRSEHTTLSPVVVEVPQVTVVQLGIALDGAGKTGSDLYHARVGQLSGRGAGPRVLRLTYDSAVHMLEDSGDVAGVGDDFTLPQERRLGQLIRMRYGVDLYVIDQFPSSTRPFYTMPLQADRPERTRSFDMYLRGEEICSGAQRISDPNELTARIAACGISPEGLKDYIAAFQYGAWPHGGFGLGLERVALFLIGASDIRQVSIFPRDPKRLTP